MLNKYNIRIRLKIFLFCLLGFWLGMLDVNYNLTKIYGSDLILGVPLLNIWRNCHVIWDFTLLLVFVTIGLILVVDL